MLDRVLVICTGNICRSPMGEALLRARFARLGRGTVESAGLMARSEPMYWPLSRIQNRAEAVEPGPEKPVEGPP